MTSSVDFPLREEHERPVESLAKALLWADLGNIQKAQAMQQVYQSLLNSRFEPEEVQDSQAMHFFQPMDNLYEDD